MDKLTQKWETDPVALGVRFDPGLGVQRCTCPECHNGSSGDNSFAVTVKEDMVLWKCHRATCGFAGAVNLIGGPYADSDKALDAAANFSRAFSNSQGATAAANGAHDVVMKLQKQASLIGLPDSEHCGHDGISDIVLLSWSNSKAPSASGCRPAAT